MNPARIRILAVGKVRRGWIQEGIELYRKRLPGLNLVELRDSPPAKEAESIQSALKHGEQPIALMEQGETLGSMALAQRIRSLGLERLAFVIGVADGLTDELKKRAHW